MIGILRQVLHVLLTGTNFITSFALSVLNVSYIIGFLLVKYLTLLFTVLNDCISIIFSVINVFYEDFCIFFEDILGKISDLAVILASSVSETFHILKSAILAVKSSVVYVYDTVESFVCLLLDSIGKSFGLAVDFAELIKWGVILIGRGFWLALQLIPLCFIYLGYSIFSLCVFLITETYAHFNSGLSFSISKANQACQWTKSYLFDFPLEAVAGLSVGTIVILIFMKYHREVRTSAIHSAHRTVRLMKSALMCVWFIMRQSLARRAVIDPAVDSDSDSTQDEGPPLRRSPRLLARAKVGEESPESLRRQLEREQEEKLCVVCQDQHKCVIVIPCRHLCLCGDCSQVIQHTTRTCPICRQDVERILPVFM